MTRLLGATLAEVLTVMAIVSLVTGAVLSVSRRGAAVEVVDQAVDLAQRRINQQRLTAIRDGEALTKTTRDIFGRDGCNQVSVVALPDGSVLAEPLCLRSASGEVLYSVAPADGALVTQ